MSGEKHDEVLQNLNFVIEKVPNIKYNDGCFLIAVVFDVNDSSSY